MRAIKIVLVAAIVCFSASSARALNCQSDCKASCKVASVFGRKIYDPGCMATCSAYKKACPIVQLPPIPTPNPNPLETLKQGCEDTYNEITTRMENFCRLTTGFQASDNSLPAAQRILIEVGAFSEAEFSNIAVRFCNLPAGDGFTPNVNKILLSDRLWRANPMELAVKLGHEMYHIRQYREWGYQKFACRYAAQVARGHGFREKNDVERSAYEFESSLADKIHTWATTGANHFTQDFSPRAIATQGLTVTSAPGANACLTATFWCQIEGPRVAPGTRCGCQTPYGVVLGQIAD